MIFYDKPQLVEILDAFYNLSGIQVGIYLYYPNGQFLFSHPSGMSSFCSIIRTKPEIIEKCRKCDLLHMEKCKKEDAPIVFNCHMGLTEVVAPLKENNVVICYFMFGQLLIEETKEQSSQIIYNNIKDAGFDDKMIKKAIKDIHCVSGSKLNAMVKILQAIISDVFITKIIDHPKITFIDNLNSYIDSNISKNILVKDICKHLNFSRNYLYMYAKKYIDCPLNEYILNRRINFAKNLLLNSNTIMKEICLKCGFSDYHYFARIFKRKTGISPRAFRHNKYNKTFQNTEEK